MTSFTSPGHNFLSGIFIFTSLNGTSYPHAREHLRSCLQLTNPCAKRKVLSLTKPKGKIYKTKSLGHYITNSCHLTKLLRHLTRIPNFTLILCLQWNTWQDMNLLCLHLVFLWRIDRSHILVKGALAWTFQFDLHFRSKSLDNLTANWKTRGPTRLDNEIINTINHHSN